MGGERGLDPAVLSVFEPFWGAATLEVSEGEPRPAAEVTGAAAAPEAGASPLEDPLSCPNTSRAHARASSSAGMQECAFMLTDKCLPSCGVVNCGQRLRNSQLGRGCLHGACFQPEPRQRDRQNTHQHSQTQSAAIPHYQLDLKWPKNSELFSGQPFGVAVDPLLSLVYVAQRGENVSKVLVFTEDGLFLGAWNTSSIEMPHGIFAANNVTHQSVWITDVGKGLYGHTIKQYDPSGKLIQVLGTAGKAGKALNPLQFDQPAEVCVDTNGEIYIVDGDGGLNNRLLKLSPDFRVLWMHGQKGTGRTQFYIPHSVTVDSVGRVWVADRGNKRIQVFAKDSGEWLGEWTSCFTEDGPYSVRLTPGENYLIVVQLTISRVNILAVPPIGTIGDCVIVSQIQLADGVRPHLVDVNVKTGAFYVAELGSEQVQKFVPHK